MALYLQQNTYLTHAQSFPTPSQKYKWWWYLGSKINL